MQRLRKGFVRHCEPPASRSGSTRASCAAETPGTGKFVRRSCRHRRYRGTIRKRSGEIPRGAVDAPAGRGDAARFCRLRTAFRHRDPPELADLSRSQLGNQRQTRLAARGDLAGVSAPPLCAAPQASSRHYPSVDARSTCSDSACCRS